MIFVPGDFVKLTNDFWILNSFVVWYASGICCMILLITLFFIFMIVLLIFLHDIKLYVNLYTCLKLFFIYGYIKCSTF